MKTNKEIKIIKDRWNFMRTESLEVSYILTVVDSDEGLNINLITGSFFQSKNS